jgi:hypothetical protein
VSDQLLTQATSNELPATSNLPDFGEDVVRILRGVAWVNLVAGFFAALWIFGEFGKRVQPGYTYLTEMNPVGVAMGVAVMFEAVVGCAFLLGFAGIVENVAKIRGLLQRQER